MTIGERIKNLRISAGLTQEELALKIGLKKQNISRYENSHCEPNIRTAKKIADALGVTIEEMAVGVSVPAPVSPPPTLSFSAEEQRLVTLYRRADERDRETVWNILGRYDEESTGAHTSAG